jgi:hypothetical protein
MTHASRLLDCLEGLNDHEREVIVRNAEDMAEGLRVGRLVYGPWEPAKDSRDLRREARMESRDRAVYDIMGDIREELRDTIPMPAMGDTEDGGLDG